MNNIFTGRALILLIGLVVIAGVGILGWKYILPHNKNNSSLQSLYQSPVTKPLASLTMDLQEPDDNVLSFQSSIIIAGNTSPNLPVMISTQSSDTVIYSKPDGSFSTVLNLDSGVNIIQVAAFDSSGEEKDAERTVYYSKEQI